MGEKPSPNYDSTKPQSGHDDSGPSYLRWVFIGGGIAFSGLLAVSLWWPNLTERTKFFIGTLWVLVTTFAVIAQAVIYRKQWAVMERQWDALTTQTGVLAAQAEIMRQSFIQNERTVKAAERGLEIAQENTIHAQRAYVMLNSATADYKTDTHVAVGYSIKNFGNTPATHVQIVSRAEVLESEPKPLTEDDIEWTLDTQTVLAPSAFYERIIDVKMTLEQRKQMGPDKPLKLWLWGMIRYRDIFGNDRRTGFRQVHHIGTGPRFGTWGKGNEIT